MTIKRVLVALGFVACVGLVLGILAMLPPHSGVTKASYDRIKIGMGRAEVEEIFGGPPARRFQHLMDNEVYVREVWFRTEGKNGAWVEFDNDHVRDSRWGGIDETILDKIRRWLHHQ